MPGHERLRGWLAIPYLGHDGRVLTIRYRCVEEHDHRALSHGKYYGTPGDPARIYNVKAIHAASDWIAVAEGELDAICLNLVGIPAVALPGVQAWKSHYERIFAGFNKVYVFADPDEAGAGMRDRIARELREQAVPVTLDGGDVNEVMLQKGPEYLRSFIEELNQ